MKRLGRLSRLGLVLVAALCVLVSACGDSGDPGADVPPATLTTAPAGVEPTGPGDAAPVAPSGAGTFSGTTTQDRPVTFTLVDGGVRDFQAGVNIFCVGQGFQFLAAIPPVAMPVQDGRFGYEGPDETGNTEIEIAGEISGSEATGTVLMTDSSFDVASGRTVFCNGDATFTATAG